jgi:hypothetical protein
MTARLRAYLKSIGIADSVLDKMEKGEPPDDPDVLRKAHETVENHPALVECRKLVAAIQEDIAEITKSDRERGISCPANSARLSPVRSLVSETR